MRIPSYWTSALAGLALALSSGLSLSAAEKPLDYRYKVEVLAEGMPQPMELELAPDGRIFFNEIGGKLRIWRPDTRKVVDAGAVEVFNGLENGFLGFALDPKFAQNQWIYLLYSPKDYDGQRLSRFTMKGDELDKSSEKVLLQFAEQRLQCCHHAGSVEFAPDGCLIFSTGDNTHPHADSEGYGPIDDRIGKEPWDAQKSSANTQDLRGKINRIRPTPDGKYTIPDGNLFPKDGKIGRPEIYVMGCRNPWRMSVDDKTGYIYWGEVGPDANADGKRGSRGYDELNQAKKPGNYGWPYFVGNNSPYARYNHDTKEVGAMYDPLHPVNEGKNNTGAKNLPPAVPAMIYWPYADSPEFPMLGKGGRTACAGPVFHYKKEFAKTDGFPEAFDNCLLFYDWQRPFVKWARLNENSDLQDIEDFTSAVLLVNDKDRLSKLENSEAFILKRPVDMQFGPDGCLYLLDYGETWAPNKDAKLLKMSYVRGNLPPVAKVSGENTAGREPLAVKLSSAGSMDHEGDTLSFEWLVHPGNKVVSREANPTITFDKPGNYVVELRVSDGRGGVSARSLPVLVGNALPEVRFIEPQNGDFFTAGKPLKYRIGVKDLEDGTSEQNDELMEARVFLNATWADAEGKSATLDPGLAMMKQSDCFNCHAIEQKIVGPPLLEVAKRYRGQAGALDATVQRVIKGSSGVWSEIPMLPHEGLTTDQVTIMVRWVYSLEEGKTGPAMIRGLAGAVTPPPDPKQAFGLLEASYTDMGRAPAGSLVGKASIRLRSRRIEAEANDAILGCRTLGGSKASGGRFLGAIDHNHHVKFDHIHLADAASVKFRVASGGVGGKIELRAGSVTGEVLASVEVKPTGGWENWVELASPLKPGPDRADVYVVFVNPGKGGLMNLDWVEFVGK